MITATNVTYGPPRGTPLQSNICFSLPAGEMLHIKGSNGGGKSLLANALLGEIPILSGKIVNHFLEHRYLPQMQNKTTHLPFSIADILFQNTETINWKEIGLLNESHLSLSWNKASGGERQRALLTRFFAQKGSLLILDEPFNHLDLSSKELVRQRLHKEMVQNPQASIILISHEDNISQWMGKIRINTLDLDLTKVKNE